MEAARRPSPGGGIPAPVPSAPRPPRSSPWEPGPFPGRPSRWPREGGGGLGPSHQVPLPTQSPQRCPSPEPRGTPGAPEQLWEASPSLRSCPMCQVDFAPRLAQLDRDSHLAQCLAERTEDVVW
ncbi:Fanconi anemia core complex-associated protein 20 [Vulpes lagopus]